MRSGLVGGGGVPKSLASLLWGPHLVSWMKCLHGETIYEKCQRCVKSEAGHGNVIWAVLWPRWAMDSMDMTRHSQMSQMSHVARWYQCRWCLILSQGYPGWSQVPVLKRFCSLGWSFNMFQCDIATQLVWNLSHEKRSSNRKCIKSPRCMSLVWSTYTYRWLIAWWFVFRIMQFPWGPRFTR